MATQALSADTQTYGTRAYTGQQLLLRSANTNKPKYNLYLSDNHKAAFDGFCTHHHLGGAHALPTPHLLCQLAGGVGLLRPEEDEAVVKELLRRVLSKIEGRKGVKSRVEGEYWDVSVHGKVADLIEQAYGRWDNVVKEAEAEEAAENEEEAKKKKKRGTHRRGKSSVSAANAKVKKEKDTVIKTEPEQDMRPFPDGNTDAAAHAAEMQRLESLKKDYDALRAAEKGLSKQLRDLEL